MLIVICPYYHALYFDYKKLRSSLVNLPKFGMYCLQGQICKNLYNYYMVCALLSHTYHVISCDVTL